MSSAFPTTSVDHRTMKMISLKLKCGRDNDARIPLNPLLKRGNASSIFKKRGTNIFFAQNTFCVLLGFAQGLEPGLEYPDLS
jgi:hypothetical protein